MMMISSRYTAHFPEICLVVTQTKKRPVEKKQHKTVRECDGVEAKSTLVTGKACLLPTDWFLVDFCGPLLQGATVRAEGLRPLRPS